jgi:Tol biopolymer transport system component
MLRCYDRSIRPARLLILALALMVQPVFAQKDKASKRQMKEANALVEINDFYRALSIYKQVWQKDSSSAELAFRIGQCMYNLRSMREASFPYLKRAQRFGVEKASYYLGILYHMQEDFPEALSAYNRYMELPKDERDFNDTEVERLKAMTLTAMEMTKHPVSAVVENIGKPVNSVYPDYSPLVTKDGNTLIFTSRREGSTGNLKDAYNEYYEDVYITKRKNGKWSDPVSISSNINTSTHDASVALSPGERTLYIYRTDEALTGGDIYLTSYNGKDWDEPAKMETQINTEEGWEASGSISSDSSIFYFSSNREGGYGGKDIYRVVKLPNGKWSQALNLGPEVNTPYDDDAPFFHADGKTLYFSSKGHTSMGGFDIFRSTLSEDGLWSNPVNLGYPVNSVDDDIYLVLSPDGTEGYFSSGRAEGVGQMDIYSVMMTPVATEYSIVRGTVTSADSTAGGVSAKITLIDDDSRQVEGVYNVSGKGKYVMIISPDRHYKIMVEADGYYPYIDYMSYVPSGNGNEMEHTIKLRKKD